MEKYENNRSGIIAVTFLISLIRKMFALSGNNEILDEDKLFNKLLNEEDIQYLLENIYEAKCDDVCWDNIYDTIYDLDLEIGECVDRVNKIMFNYVLEAKTK